MYPTPYPDYQPNVTYGDPNEAYAEDAYAAEAMYGYGMNEYGMNEYGMGEYGMGDYGMDASLANMPTSPFAEMFPNIYDGGIPGGPYNESGPYPYPDPDSGMGYEGMLAPYGYAYNYEGAASSSVVTGPGNRGLSQTQASWLVQFMQNLPGRAR